ncbi:interferon alpha/beta receptor 2 [Dipodomys spectabilis]|uniref:interferon alpha/beta receptor 2 n=1 Tax=Dipodomys spectabilis TaxID=105255 RepID=UPI001C54B196|nr:interferon alpha/beta receptor 2 [Dipodomys spectabilis]
MLLNYRAPAVHSLLWCLTVYMSLMFGASHSLNGFSEESCILKMTVQNFRLILSWELKNTSVVPTHYTLQYTVMSKLEGAKAIGNCTNITSSFCDVTDVWEDMHETYIPLLEGFRGNTTLLQCVGSILATNLSFEPPEFGIVGFTDHMNVIVTFPPVIPKIYGKDISHHLSLVIKEHGEEMVKTHKPRINGDISGNFSYVIDNLIPNTNYCVSVYFEPKGLGKVIRSPLKCTRLQPVQESGLSESAKAGTLIILGLLVAVSVIIMLKRVGYICLKTKLPKVLKRVLCNKTTSEFYQSGKTNFAINFCSYRSLKFSKPPPLEAVDMVEVISIHRKKKVWNYNYDDSDSDTEVTPKANATGYTMHGLVGRLLSPDPASSIPSHESQPIDPDADESDEAEAGAELDPSTAPEPQPWQSGDSSEPYERRESLLQDPFLADNSSSPEGSGDRIIFNVDLNSVFLRVVDKDVDEASLVSSLTEEMADPEEDADGGESTLLIASGERTQAAHLSPSSQCLRTEDALSDQSDADADMQDGYLMR